MNTSSVPIPSNPAVSARDPDPVAVPWLVVGMGSTAFGKERRAVTALRHMPRIHPHFLTSIWEDGTVSALLRAHGFEFTPVSVGYLGRARLRWTLLNLRLMPKLFWMMWKSYRAHQCRGVLVLALQPFANVLPAFWLLRHFCGARVVFYLGDIPANTGPNRLLCRVMTHMSRVIIVNSDAVRRGLARAGVPADRVQVIYNGVVLERLQDAKPLPWRQQFNWRDDALVVGYAGQFSESKGASDFVAAAEHVLDDDDRCRFVLAGQMDKKNACYRELASHVRQRQLDEKLVFAGWVTDMERVYATLDMMVVPSRHEEAAANVLIEAAAAGIPVIATRVGGTPELVDHGVTGILIEPRSPKQIAEAIMTLASDPVLRRTMGEAGKQRARAMFDTTRNARLVEHIIGNA